MSKRRAESTSSSSSSDGESFEGSSKFSIADPSFTLAGYGEVKKSMLATGNGSRKKARNGCVSEERVQNQVAPTSAQLQRELGIVVKNEESEESEVEHTHACSSSGAPEVKRSKRERVSSKGRVISKGPKKLTRSKKVPVLKTQGKYFEGCLVMGSTCIRGYPLWPGMIRKASPNEDPKQRDFTCIERGRTWFRVQFFINPTPLYWRIPGNLRVFDAAKPNLCTHLHSAVVSEFEKGVRIARAASNFSVKARLTKFTLPEDAGIDGLLREIDEWNGQQAPRVDSVVQNDNEATASSTKLRTEELNSINTPNNDSVAQDEAGPAPQPQRNRRSAGDLVAGLMKKDREREEAIKALTRDNSKLAEENTKLKTTNTDLTLRLQSKEWEQRKIESLEGKLKEKDKLIAELRQDNEKMRSLEALLDVDTTEDGTGT